MKKNNKVLLRYLIPRSRQFEIKLVQKESRPKHLVVGLWVATMAILMIPHRRHKLREENAMKAYNIMARTVGLL